MLWADYRKGRRRARFCDSGNLFPRWTVKDLGSRLGFPKLEPRPELTVCLRRGISWGDLEPEWQQEAQLYCQRDAEIVYRAVADVQELALSLGGELKPTAPGVAMDVFRRGYLRRSWVTPGPTINKVARQAFYGGRVENFAVGKVEAVNLYDVNALYPDVYGDLDFPDPDHLELQTGPLTASALEGVEGVAGAQVRVPPSFVPPLPQRLQGKLFFPSGHLTGAWTVRELLEACDRGCELLRLDWVLGSRLTISPFRKFVDELYKRRQGAMVDDPWKAGILKLLLNSLYGRFGLDPDRGVEQLVKVRDKAHLEKLKGYQLVPYGDAVLARGPLSWGYQPAYVNVLFAAQIAAGARIRLLRALEEQDTDLVYCDTDSIMTRGTMPQGAGLGEWKLQMEQGAADLLGPKEYVLHNRMVGESYVVKGVPEHVAREYLLTGTARFQRALKVREAIAKGDRPSEWVETVRTHHPTLPKRLPALAEWDRSGAWCLTVPWEEQELQRWAPVPDRWAPSAKAGRAEPPPPEWVQSLALQAGVPPELLSTFPPE